MRLGEIWHLWSCRYAYCWGSSLAGMEIWMWGITITRAWSTSWLLGWVKQVGIHSGMEVEVSLVLDRWWLIWSSLGHKSAPGRRWRCLWSPVSWWMHSFSSQLWRLLGPAALHGFTLSKVLLYPNIITWLLGKVIILTTTYFWMFHTGLGKSFKASLREAPWKASSNRSSVLTLLTKYLFAYLNLQILKY